MTHGAVATGGGGGPRRRRSSPEPAGSVSERLRRVWREGVVPVVTRELPMREQVRVPAVPAPPR